MGQEEKAIAGKKASMAPAELTIFREVVFYGNYFGFGKLQ